MRWSREVGMNMTTFRRTKCYRVCIRLLKLLAVLLLLTLVVSPVRNVLFWSVIPGVWTTHNSVFLIRVLMDNQHFPVDSTPRGKSPVHIKADPRDIERKFISKNTYPYYDIQKRHILETTTSDEKSQRRKSEFLKFEPIMSEKERAISLYILDVFLRAIEAANLTYFAAGGTMLGAVRHHGLIPWDDDYDFAMNASDWVKIRDVLSSVKGFELYSPSDSQWKFYMSNLPVTEKPFKWPNVDIFFFNEDDTYLWSLTWGIKYALCYRKVDMFPLGTRKFERWNIPVPRKVNYFTSLEFGDYSNQCATAYYIHKTNIGISYNEIVYISCKTIYDSFPFVFPKPGPKPGTVIEVLKIAGHVVGNSTVPIE